MNKMAGRCLVVAYRPLIQAAAGRAAVRHYVLNCCALAAYPTSHFTVRKLRSALNDTAKVPRYAETLRGRGYRFIDQLDTIKPRPPADTVAIEMLAQSEGALSSTSIPPLPPVPWPLSAGALALEKPICRLPISG